jgi:lysophospholipase L1-like esterase
MKGRQARGWGMSAHDMMKTTTKKAANSIVGKLTAAILATGAVAVPQAAADVLVIGDSLEVGSAPHLRAALAGTAVDVDASPGRTSSEGVGVMARLMRPEHDVVVFPLGTNDLSAGGFAASLAEAGRLAAGRCVVVATIARRRPPASELNEVVSSFAAQGNVQVADWRGAAASPGVLGRDGTHATGAGYALRAQLLAEAVRACLSGGGAAGIPAPRDPDVRVPSGAERDAGRPGTAGGRPGAPGAAGAPGPPTARTGPGARPVRLPVRRALTALTVALHRAASPAVAAVRNALTAATKTEPEPVLGAP